MKNFRSFQQKKLKKPMLYNISSPDKFRIVQQGRILVDLIPYSEENFENVYAASQSMIAPNPKRISVPDFS